MKSNRGKTQRPGDEERNDRKGKTIQFKQLHLVYTIALTKMFVSVKVCGFYCSPSSAEVRPPRCSTGSEGSVWGNTARPAWPRPRACSIPLANRSA